MTPLRQRMREDLQVRNLFPMTQRAYLEQVSRFATSANPLISWGRRRFAHTRCI